MVKLQEYEPYKSSRSGVGSTLRLDTRKVLLMHADHTLNAPSAQDETRLIPLSQGKFAIVDAADYEWLMQWKWFAMKQRYEWYAYRKDFLPNGKRYSLAIHRAILDAPPESHVDHVDCNGLNNTRANLRLATPAENARNHRISKSNTSGYKGVDFHKATNKWRARICLNRESIELGFFDTPQAAAAAYDKAATELFGEFARTNP